MHGAADTDPWQPIQVILKAGIPLTSINLNPDYEGFEEPLWSAACTWDASSLSPGAYDVRVTVHNMGGESSTSTQVRTYQLVKSNTVVPDISSVNNLV